MGPALLYGHWVCEHCKNVVQAEAVSKKRKIEKEGGSLSYPAWDVLRAEEREREPQPLAPEPRGRRSW